MNDNSVELTPRRPEGSVDAIVANIVTTFITQTEPR